MTEVDDARLGSLEDALSSIQDTQLEIYRILQSHQAGIDDLKADNPGAIAFETIIGLALTALSDLEQAANGSPSEIDRQLIRFNDRILRSLEWQTDRRIASEDAGGTLSTARVAAEWACSRHPGRYSSPKIEEALRSVGRSLLEELPLWSRGSGNRILHVMTSAQDTGGHTRLVDRWIRFDSARTHTIVLTEQGDLPVPAWLRDHATGGVTQLQGASPAARVTELATRMADFDLVVLHLHPFEVVAIAACADPAKRPPVLLLNCSDHLFWLGVGIADGVVNLRPVAASIDLERRGVAPERSMLLPLPLDQPLRSLEPTQAKEIIGFPVESLMMLCIAPEWKFSSHFGMEFAEMIEPVLEEEDRSYLVVIGADPAAEHWEPLISKYGRRVHILPPTHKTRAYMEAADIYLDSAPLPSMTAVLEGALMGIPAVTLTVPELDYLGSHYFGFGVDSLPRFGSINEWRVGILSLLRDPILRRDLGAASIQAIVQRHTPSAWLPQLEQVYECTKKRALPPLAPIGASFENRDLALASFQQVAAQPRSIETLLAAHGLLPRNLT